MSVDTTNRCTSQGAGNGWSPQLITYCSNVHAGESLDDVLLNLNRFYRPVRLRRGIEIMTSGLWLSASTAETLQDEKQLARFKTALHNAGLSLTSINGFPFGNFHARQVKEKVYLPDWSDTARLRYTINLSNILAACLPDYCDEGAISTLPLGYRPSWDADKQVNADNNIKAVLQHLAELHQKTGKKILLCLEMEPDCALESSEECLHYFQQHVQADMPHAEYLGVCYDVCHQAVMFENIAQSMTRITAAGIRIGKIQLSNALQVDLDTVDKQQTLHYLREFSEPKYLHQVKTENDLQLCSSPDLAQALAAIDSTGDALPQNSPWRIHFHVPLHTESLLHPTLSTTRQALYDVFDFLQQHDNIRPYLEVETYSWQVLPEELRPTNDEQLIDGIVSELDWVERALQKRNLLSATEKHDK